MGAALVAASLAVPNMAEAFPNRHGSGACDDNSLGFIFAGSNWSGYQTDWVTGAQWWNALNTTYWEASNADVSGTITLQLQARRLDYPSGSDCEHVPDLDLNTAPTYPNGSSYVDVGQPRTVSVQDGWNYVDLPSSWQGAASWEGVDIRLKVYKKPTVKRQRG